MKRIRAWAGAVMLASCGAGVAIRRRRIARGTGPHRTPAQSRQSLLRNPTTQPQAVDEFKKALDLAPNSPREW
jgi:hypothetical protein